jgi:hypothetical protein
MKWRYNFKRSKKKLYRTVNGLEPKKERFYEMVLSLYSLMFDGGNFKGRGPES